VKKFKRLKGFTLVELVIVMAIFAIMMSAIMTMATPINKLADISKGYDSQRTITQEINSYVCQNVKYATYAQVYTNHKNLLPAEVTAFATSSGANLSDIIVIAIINNFQVVNVTRAVGVIPNSYNGSVTGKDYGRIFRSSTVTATNKINYYTAMGKWFYGKNKYQFDVALNLGVLSITTKAFENNSQSLSSTETSKFINYEPSTMPNAIVGTGTNVGTNSYILYTIN